MDIDEYLYQKVGYTFVGDSYLILNVSYEYNKMDGIAAEIQTAINIWGGDSKATSGALRTKNSFSPPSKVSVKGVFGSKSLLTLMQFKLS